MKTHVGRGWALFGVLLLVVLLAGSAISQAAPGGSGTPAKIKTATDAAKGKLDKALAAKVAGGSNATVPVFVSMRGDTARAEALLSDAHATAAGEVSLVVGRIPAQQSVKLAGLAGVVSVGLVQFKQDGQPLGFGDPELGVPASGIEEREGALEQEQRSLRQGAAAEDLELRRSRGQGVPRREDAQLRRRLERRLHRRRRAPQPSSTAAPTSAIPTC